MSGQPWFSLLNRIGLEQLAALTTPRTRGAEQASALSTPTDIVRQYFARKPKSVF